MSPLPAGPYLPTGALVAVAWLGQRVPGIASGQVATRLPKNVTSWVDEGFVQVTVVASAPDVETVRRRTLVQVDCWGANLAADESSQTKPAILKATRLAELISRAAEDDVQRASGGFGRPVTMPTNYAAARVLSVYPTSEPSEVLDDPSNFGRVTLDLALDWARV